MEAPLLYPSIPDAKTDPGMPYNHGIRTHHNRIWGIIFGGVMVASIAAGAYGYQNQNGQLRTEVNMSDPSSCNAQSHAPGVSLGRMDNYDDYNNDNDADNFLTYTKTTLVLSALAAIVVGVIYVLLLKSFARTMVKLTVLVVVLAPAVAGGYLFTMPQGERGPPDYANPDGTPPADTKTLGGVLLAVACVIAGVSYLMRKNLDLCGRLLETAAAGLKSNPMLIVVSMVLKMMLVVVLVGMLFLLIPLFSNGEVVQTRESYNINGASCSDKDGFPVDCCVYQMKTWAALGAAINIFTIYWTVFLVFQMRLYTIAGSISQWYWAPAGSPAKGTTSKALIEAFSAAFSTLCLGGLILFFAEMIQNICRKARRSANPLMKIVGWCLGFAFEMIKFLTKFSIIQVAISGDAFCDAGKRVGGTLARNGLAAATVWWVPPVVLQFTGFLLASLNSVIVYYSVHANLAEQELVASDAVFTWSLLCALVAFCFAEVVLSFLMSILLNVVDTVFVCYAIDKDAGLMSQPAVHECFAEMPSTKADPADQGNLVAQPDGGTGYAPVAGV